jgi:hypothetical protein
VPLLRVLLVLLWPDRVLLLLRLIIAMKLVDIGQQK